jgi:hypothetical protein
MDEYRSEMSFGKAAILPKGTQLRIDKVVYYEQFEGWYLYTFCKILSGPLTGKTSAALFIVKGDDSNGKVSSIYINWRAVSACGEGSTGAP